MKTPLLLVAALVGLVPLAGCISKQVVPAAGISNKTICIVRNPAVRLAFRDAYERQLQARGYETSIVDDIHECRTSTTYHVRYGTHMDVHLAAALLTIYENGQEIGRAAYRAPYANPAKHGRVEGKIADLVKELLP